MKHEVIDKVTVFVFPGIGVELSGHEKTLFSEYTKWYEPFFDEIADVAQLDFRKLLLSDSLSTLSELQSQLFIYAFSAGTAKLCVDNGRQPSCVAGYSFGVYAALYTLKVLSFSDGILLLDKAYELMNACREGRDIGMCAVIGLSLEELKSIIAMNKLNAINHINSNNEYCHIFGGNREQIITLNSAALDAEAVNAIGINASLPYHLGEFTRQIAEPFTAFCESLLWHDPQLPLYSTVDCKKLQTKEAIRRYIVNQLTTPINWFKTMETLYSTGCTHVVECGPGISLTQNARFISGTAKWINCKNLKNRLRS